MAPGASELAKAEGRQPTWEMALLYPDQGRWTSREYLELDAGRHVELSEGKIEFLPMPDEKHQAIVLLLVNALRAFAASRGGKAIMAPFPVKLWNEKFREPDVAYMRPENLGRCLGKYWEGADVVIEVVSESNREHDTETKREEYATTGIPEYWIVDPAAGRITVLKLEAPDYRVHGEFARGQVATSALLAGFSLEVGAVLDAE
ncbi:MAG: Uma2 family endonuclease [Planctomycetes bacterium]|nr:Uma2 family endonuclease [Planctomycetota bacterium]